jgi:hypothetical protein
MSWSSILEGGDIFFATVLDATVPVFDLSANGSNVGMSTFEVERAFTQSTFGVKQYDGVLVGVAGLMLFSGNKEIFDRSQLPQEVEESSVVIERRLRVCQEEGSSLKNCRHSND